MSAISGFCEKCNKFRKRHCDGNRNTCRSILFDTIEALQQENEQLNADVEALRKARNLLQRYKDHIKSYPCECKFGLDFYGNKTPFRDGEMCERCAELAEIDKAIGEKEDVKKAGYRKQSEVVKEFAEKIVKKFGKSCSEYYPEFIEMTSVELYYLAEQYGKEEL